MSSTIAEIRVPGLTKLDKLEIDEYLDAGSVRFENESMPGGKHGELLTIAVVAATIIGLRGLAAWLLKDREHNRIRKRIEIVHADGTTHIETIDMDLSASQAPKAAILKELAKLTDIDIAALEQNT
jgi:hypothetical protein